jgi:hypothetical protein
MFRDNIKSGYLYITLKDGETVKFSSLTSVTNTTVVMKKGIKQMQNPKSKPLYYKTGNQEVSTAQFELKPINLDEFNFINKIWNEDLEFDAVFSHKDGSINYVYPSIEKQPIQENISEDDTTFVVTLSLLCGSIEPKPAKKG